MSTLRWFLAATPIFAATLAPSCVTTNPCDDYVDYICACHQDDPSFDCATLQTTYADAPPDLQDECAVQLDDQQAVDSEAGLDCAY